MFYWVKNVKSLAKKKRSENGAEKSAGDYLGSISIDSADAENRFYSIIELKWVNCVKEKPLRNSKSVWSFILDYANYSSNKIEKSNKMKNQSMKIW